MPSLSSRLRAELAHAQRFSLLAQGAYLLYNVMLAEAAVGAGMTNHEGRPERHRVALARWSDRMTEVADSFAAWDVEDMWRALAEVGKHVSRPTRRFIEAWASMALDRPAQIADDPPARRLVEERERQLKHGLARLQNRRSLENWGGGSSTGRLSFRWPNARQIVTDVQAGLESEGSADA